MEEPTWPADENERLYEGLRQKAPWAYKEVYRRFYPPFLKYVLQNSGTEDDARDVFQDFIVKLIEKENFELREVKALPGYLTQMAKNQWLMRLRKDKQMPLQNLEALPETADTTDGANDETLREEKKRLAEEAFKLLGEDCKRLLKLFYFEKKSLKEIAELLDLNVGYTRLKRFRCMEKLRELLGK